MPARQRAELRTRDQAIQVLKLNNLAGRMLAGGTFDFGSKKVAELKHKTPDPIRGYFLTEESPKAPTTHILLRGSATRPGATVEPGVPTVLVSKQPEFLKPDSYTTRRRLSLANWIANSTNPLTARVIVNRVWQWNFGNGLVRTESDFGVNGEEPSHPELLDWLADWFVRNGWSIKKLNRLILSSNVYRQMSAVKSSLGTRIAEDDPEDRLLCRFPYRRLEVEAIRDSVLAISGRLNREMEGPGMFLPIPKEALDGNSDPKTAWTPSSEPAISRRTIYAVLKRLIDQPAARNARLVRHGTHHGETYDDNCRPAGAHSLQWRFCQPTSEVPRRSARTRGRPRLDQTDRFGLSSRLVPAAPKTRN